MTDGYTGVNHRKSIFSPQAGKTKDFKVIQDGGKTYVIIVKDNKVGSGQLPLSCPLTIEDDKYLTKDSVKRSLVNLGEEMEDDFYTPASELAEVFGVKQNSGKLNGQQQVSQMTVKSRVQLGQTRTIDAKGTDAKRLCRLQNTTKSCLRLNEPLNDINIKQSVSADQNCVTVKRETDSPSSIPSRRLFASPIPGSTEGNQFTVLTEKTPDCSDQFTVDSSSYHKYAYQTPTPELNTTKTTAVRKILIVQNSPQYRKSATPKSKPALDSPKVVLRDSNSAAHQSSNTHILFSPKLTLCSPSPKSSPSVYGKVLTSSPNVQSENCKGPSLNDSLTNIQWLGALASDGLAGPNTKTNSGVPCGKEIEKVSLECGRLKRPAYSYMMLIRMALETRPDKRLTLREICKWIEETFPFYKHSAKPGWKNSIRHNLSVYDMFVRVPSKPKQHGAQWTVRETNVKKTKYSKSGQNKGAITSSQCITAAVNSITSGMFAQSGVQEMAVKQEIGINGMNKTKKKGPTPILPRPTMPAAVFRNGNSVMPLGGSLQTYALIPITSLNGAISGTPSLAMAPAQSVPISLATNPVSQSSAMSVVGISNTFLSENRSDYTCNVIKEAWQAASAMETNEVYVTEQTETVAKVKPGLPKPKMYAIKSKGVGKKSVSRINGGGALLSPVRCEGLVCENQLDSDLENGLPTPLRQLLDTPVGDILSTSTPNKPLPDSPKWMSPISSMTPNRHDRLADGSFLDFLPPGLDMNSPTIITPVKSLEAWMKIASGLLDTPNAALMSPHGEAGAKEAQKHTETINHLLAEIDPCLIEELDNCQFNLSNLNWLGTDNSIHVIDNT